jgi:hypothetical protein
MDRQMWAPDDGLDPPGAEFGDDLPIEPVYVSSEEEIPKEEKEEGKVDAEALKKENEEFRARMAQLEEQANLNKSLQEGIQGLGKNMTPQRPQPQPVQQPGESDADFRKRFNEHLYDDPAALMDEWQMRKLSPLVSQIITNNMAMGRRFLQLDPEKAPNYKTYRDEIENEVNRMPPQEKLQNPDFYDKAYERVMARHIDDIVNQRVQAALKEELEKSSTKNQAADAAQGHTERTTYRKKTPMKEYRVLTAAERAAAKSAGVDEDTYWNYLKRRGLK